MRDKILEIINSKPKHFSRMIKNNSDSYNWVLDNTRLTDDRPFAEHIRSALYNETNVCEYGNIKKFKDIRVGFVFCGRANSCECCRKSVSENVIKSASQKSTQEIKEISEKRKKTNLEKYGVDNIGKIDKARENHRKFYDDEELVKKTIKQYKQTNLERYGVENPQQNKEIHQKTKQTNLERYGVENPQQNKEIHEKTKQTNLERYGVHNPSLNEVIKKKISGILSSYEVRQKTIDTNLKKYGTEYPILSSEIQKKVKETNMKMYGVEYPTMNPEIADKIRKELLSPEVRNKIKQTNIERYGVENPMYSDEINQKRKDTNIERYGVESPYSSPIIREKIKQTNIERYGVENPIYSDEINQKRKNTNIDRYGVESPYSSPVIREKIKQTNIEKYDAPYPSQRHLSKETIEILNDKEKLAEFIKDKSAYEVSKELGIVNSSFYTITRKYGISDLYRRNATSYLEIEMKEFLDELNIDYETNNRSVLSGLELDFYIPEHNLAIEMNGIYWHSDLFISDKNYHYNKWKECADKGIRLLSIFEDDWVNQNEKIKNMIKNHIGLGETLSIQDIDIRIIDDKQAKSFIEKHNIQKLIDGIHYGAFDSEDNLLEIMTFNRIGDNIYKMCNYEYKYPELFLKLFNYVKNELKFKKVIAFIDNMYFNSDLYKENEFKLYKIHNPDYSYLYKRNRIDRSIFAKNSDNKFPEITELINEGMTEFQITNILEMPRLYDCGKCEWIWKIT